MGKDLGPTIRFHAIKSFRVQCAAIPSGRFGSWRRRWAANGVVEARYAANTFDVTTSRVARFALWLSPRMVDFTRPVVVRVNGVERFRDRVSPDRRFTVARFLDGRPGSADPRVGTQWPSEPLTPRGYARLGGKLLSKVIAALPGSQSARKSALVRGTYETHEVEEYLTADAAKLEAFVKNAERETLKLEGRQACMDLHAMTHDQIGPLGPGIEEDTEHRRLEHRLAGPSKCVSLRAQEGLRFREQRRSSPFHSSWSLSQQAAHFEERSPTTTARPPHPGVSRAGQN